MDMIGCYEHYGTVRYYVVMEMIEFTKQWDIMEMMRCYEHYGTVGYYGVVGRSGDDRVLQNSGMLWR